MTHTMISKSEYAERCGVSPGAVSKWIRRGKLPPSVFTTGGQVIVALADEALALNVAPLRRTIAAEAAREASEAAVLLAEARADEAEAERQAGASRVGMQLLQAKALSASVDAERKRQQLNAERGKYVVAAAAAAEFARVFSGFIERVEASIADAGIELQLSREQILGLRRWWRGQRASAAGALRAEAVGKPEFVAEDDVAA